MILERAYEMRSCTPLQRLSCKSQFTDWLSIIGRVFRSRRCLILSNALAEALERLA
jgi:hypothetical protein